MNYKIFDSYKDRMVAFSTEREGYFFNGSEGMSQGAYGGLNLCHYVNDELAHVDENRALFCSYHDIERERLFVPRQTHSRNVKRAEMGIDLEETDGLICNLHGACIGVNTADCLPVLIYDPTHHAAAAIHAGWRGLASRIVTNGIEMMMRDFGSVASDLVCAVGPAISAEIYEVGDELKPLFAQAGFPIEEIFIDRTDWTKSHLSLQRAVRWELVECGVKENNIEISDVCTYQNSDKYFSARRLGIDSGRIFSGIILK